jgi:hypothetical protein
MSRAGKSNMEIGEGMPSLRRKTIAELQVILRDLRQRDNDNWLPACGGTEVPFDTRSGRRLQYCYQPSTGKHAYLDCLTDIILTDEEARFALGKY